MAAKDGPLRPHEERQAYPRHRSGDGPRGSPDLGDSFLIVTEGEVTETMYFTKLRHALKIRPMTVWVLHPDCTDAVGLVRSAIGLCEPDGKGNRRGTRSSGRLDGEVIDHVWVLFDTDVPERDGRLQEAMQLAAQHNIHVGHSTPSVELWLLLHFRDRPGPLLTSDAAESALSEAWEREYSKSAGSFDDLWRTLLPNIPRAVARGSQVREYHSGANSAFPPNPSTELDLLVAALNASVQQHLRILR